MIAYLRWYRYHDIRHDIARSRDYATPNVG